MSSPLLSYNPYHTTVCKQPLVIAHFQVLQNSRRHIYVYIYVYISKAFDFLNHKVLLRSNIYGLT